MDNHEVSLKILDSLCEIKDTLKNFTESLSEIIKDKNAKLAQEKRVWEAVNKKYSEGDYMKRKPLQDLCNNCIDGENYCESCREGKGEGIKCKYKKYQY
uniref:Uncharacterized protein n=1 Tax=viral metagenome TaxID=1070528 RepID=A0A6M3XGN5_9ZZZZ